MATVNVPVITKHLPYILPRWNSPMRSDYATLSVWILYFSLHFMASLGILFLSLTFSSLPIHNPEL